MFWSFLLYLFYGLAFFTLGVAILSRDVRFSELAIAKILWLLAVFGIVHGFHEWLELLDLLDLELRSPAFSLFRLIVVSLSFFCLLYFGLFLNLITISGERALQTTAPAVKALIGICALSLAGTAIYLDLSSGSDITIRRMIAFPGGLLAGVGLIAYSRTVRHFSDGVARNFVLAGSFMVCYAVFTGLFPSSATVPGIGLQVIALRGISALLIMFFTIRALSVFNLEQHKQVQDKLLRFSQSEKLASMGILAAGIAHEINNPLTNASLNLEMLKDLIESDPKTDRKLAAIERNIERASRIARELLHFSREKQTVMESVDLNQILEGTLHLIKNHQLSSIIHFSPGDIPLIRGIPWKLEEVFINLLMNSLDACTEEDRIDVETCSDPAAVMAVISDTGHGIAEEHRHRVFDPFYTTKEIGKGTGLGLSVCYTIIKQHGGDISLMSSEHGGTVVTITLPETPHDY
jgi:two-component system, NtrC family, sensor kinase